MPPRARGPTYLGTQAWNSSPTRISAGGTAMSSDSCCLSSECGLPTPSEPCEFPVPPEIRQSWRGEPSIKQGSLERAEPSFLTLASHEYWEFLDPPC